MSSGATATSCSNSTAKVARPRWLDSSPRSESSCTTIAVEESASASAVTVAAGSAMPPHHSGAAMATAHSSGGPTIRPATR